MTSLLTQAQDGFTAAFGYAPDGLWSAPGRVNLIGEHTDYNEGFVLPFAIDRRTVAALALRADGLVRVSSSAVSLSRGSLSTGSSSEGTPAREFVLAAASPAAVRGWAAYPLGVAWGLGQVGAELAGLPGFDVHFASDVPVGAGLSSSAAIECALAVALNEAWRLGFDRTRLVEATHLAENGFVGAPTGILDQSAALLSAEGAALFLDCRDGSSVPVDLGLARDWHFAMAWLLVLNGAVYLLFGLFGHFRRDLIPERTGICRPLLRRRHRAVRLHPAHQRPDQLHHHRTRQRAFAEHSRLRYRSGLQAAAVLDL